jgi:glycosyltransferase involved in cell wall biosynthesis
MAARVAKERPDARFVIIGDGALRDEVATAVTDADLGDRLHVVAHLPEADRALPSMDVFVMSSVFEGAPYAPMEAMRACVPLVLTDVAGSADLVTDGVEGRKVPARDAEALAAAVADTLADRPAARRRAEAAHHAVATRFAGDEMGRRTRAVYTELL